MDPRAINFNVLRRHDPQISSIIDSTSYAVIYRYFHGAWSKTGFEGTMFVFQRDILPRYGVFVLNRQGLDNLCEGLLPGWDVDLDEGLIIWRSAGATGEADDDVIYGIWVYEEKDRSRIATTMQSLIDTAAANQDQDPDPDPDPDPEPPSSSPPPVSLSHPVPRVPIITAGQSISLDQLFGVGSVCSDPPPQTSALPHPGASVVDPDEHADGQLPSKVMSPDPSDLPKGMQLLDSLFHKAGIRSQPSNQSLAPEPAPQPLSIQQLLQGPAASHVAAPAAAKPPEPAPRERRRSSNSDGYQPQTVLDVGHHPNHRTLNPSSRPELRATNPHGSRRSSAGSSSHSRSDKAPLAGGQPSYNHHPSHAYPAHPGTMVAAPVPIENANAEARHNILSLLGHPAAARPSHGYSGGANGQAQTSGAARLRGSPDSFGSAGKEGVYGGGRGGGGGGGPGSIYSHGGSQQASPQHGGQGPTPPSYGGAHTGSAEHSPGQPAPQHSHSHSPSGPRQPDGRAPHGGAAFAGSVWPFDKIPTRALSPLNPAAQQYRHGSPATNLRTAGQHWKQPHPVSPPVVNDSSRPGRTGSYGSSSAGGGGSGAAGSGSVKSKVAVECLDEVLGEGKFGVGELDCSGGGGAGGRDGAPVDKKMFVNGILELIKTNGAFVDSLYARYLARYAERYL